MHSTTLFTLAAAAAAVQGAVIKRDTFTLTGDGLEEYFYGTCFPQKNVNQTAHSYSGEPDYNFPCEVFRYISQTCISGSPPSSDGFDFYNDAQTSPRDQQICFCESQYFDQLQGCVNCIQKHGFDKVPGFDQGFSPSFTISAFSSSYCQASVTPTAALLDYLDKYNPTTSASETSGASSAKATFSEAPQFQSSPTITFTDPIGNKTDVSLYFTPSVTGAQLTQISAGVPVTSSNSQAELFSHSSSLASSTPTHSTAPLSINTNAAGQIVATASAAAANSAGASAKSSSSKGAAPTAAADKLAVAGMIGLAAVVAAL